MNKTFRVKALSPALFLITLFFILISGVYFVGSIIHNPGNRFLTIVLTLALSVLGLYATRFTSIALTTWTFTETEIEIRWEKQFLLGRRHDLQVPWTEIRQYKFRPERNFDLLKIKLFDGKIIRLWHLSTTDSDDFSHLIRNFEKQVVIFNEHANTLTPIERIKTFYESRLAIMYVVLVGLCLVAIPVLLIILPRKLEINWGGLLVAYSGGLFYIFKIIETWKKKSKKRADV